MHKSHLRIRGTVEAPLSPAMVEGWPCDGMFAELLMGSSVFQGQVLMLASSCTITLAFIIITPTLIMAATAGSVANSSVPSVWYS